MDEVRSSKGEVYAREITPVKARKGTSVQHKLADTAIAIGLFATCVSGQSEANPPCRLLGICNIFRASALDRMTSCLGDGSSDCGEFVGSPSIPGLLQAEPFHARRISIFRKAIGHPPLPPFRYFDKGNLAVVGKNCAVLHSAGVQISVHRGNRLRAPVSRSDQQFQLRLRAPRLVLIFPGALRRKKFFANCDAGYEFSLTSPPAHTTRSAFSRLVRNTCSQGTTKLSEANTKAALFKCSFL